jgi:hypothetical protein
MAALSVVTVPHAVEASKKKKNVNALNQTGLRHRRLLDARLAQTVRHITPRATFGRLALSCLQCSRARRPLLPTQVGRWDRGARNLWERFRIRMFVHVDPHCAPRRLDKHVHELHELERAVRAQLTFPEEEWQVRQN